MNFRRLVSLIPAIVLALGSGTAFGQASTSDAPISLLPSVSPSNPSENNHSQPAPAPVVQPSTSSPKPAAAPAASSAISSGSVIEVRAGEHGSYNRLVFDWPKAVDYKVEQDNGQAIITFGRSARINVAGLRGLPSDISVKSADNSGKTSSVVLAIPPTSRLRHFVSGSKVVVDVVRAADAPPPQTVAGAPAPLDTTAGEPPQPSVAAQPSNLPELPGMSDQVPTHEAKPGTAASPSAPVPPAQASSPSAPASSSSETPSAPVTTSLLPMPKKKPGSMEPPPPAAAPVPAVVSSGMKPALTATTPPEPEKTFSLSVPWEQPVAAAVFHRAGYLWIVFDRHQDADTRLLRRLGGEAVTQVEQLPNHNATILRLIVQPDYEVSLRRDGLLWVIDLTHQAASEPKMPIPVTSPAALTSGIGISLAVNDPGSLVTVTDPEVGDQLMVIPVIPLGAGIYPERDTPDVTLLATLQGIALSPHIDGIDTKISRTGVTIGLPVLGGLRLSSSGGVEQQAPTAGKLFDIPAWLRGGPEHFDEERKILEEGLLDLSPAHKATAHVQAARFFFANGFAPEALGYLRIAASEEPTLVDTAPFRALRGATNVLMGRWDMAVADLDSPLLKDDPEAQYWRAGAHAASSNTPGDQDKVLASGLVMLRPYPKPLKWPLAVQAAQSALAAADDATVQSALDYLVHMAETPSEQAQLAYLSGAYAELTGQFDKALYNYDAAENGENREYRARAALAAVELQLKTKSITPRDAVDRLNHLRFAWREEDFEFKLLWRLAELEAQAGDYPSALRSLRSLVTNYPDNRDTPQATKMMNDMFTQLYLNGEADKMSPVSAIALYDEFRDLTPSGNQGDEMIRKLADRLASVDLLDRAAELLKYQVIYRLHGLDKARVGAQLTVLNLLNQQPAQALDALQISALDGLPAELAQQRRHLQARALSDSGRVSDAITLLASDRSSEAALLRAEIYWRNQDWPNAAGAFELLVPPPAHGETLDDGSARLVLSWATALTLSNDERGLALLRRNFGAAMNASPYKDGFNLLTSALDKELPNMQGIASKIKEAEGFQTFMGDYKKRLQANGLSAIN